MKKIINGRRYDTETAKALGYDDYLYPSDFGYWAETLYRKNTGEFFLYGTGGPASKYAESIGMNQWSGGSKIIPLSVEAAQKWAEEHLSADEYEKIFGEVTEEEKRTATFSLPEDVIEMIKRGAAEKGVKLSEYVADCVKAFQNI